MYNFLKRLQRILKFRNTLWDMAIKQLRGKYAGSLLGLWWAVVTPLLVAVSINLVFNLVFKMNIEHYAIFVLSGIIPWLFFTNALIETTGAFLQHASVLKQSVVPREFIPLSCVLAHLLNFLIGFLFLSPLFVGLHLGVIKLLPLFCLVLLLQTIFIFGLGLVFSVLNVFFRDISHFLSTLFMIWFWVTPIFYSVDMLPADFRWIWFYNPMSYFVISYQAILFSAEIPSVRLLLSVVGISVITLLFGYAIFCKVEQKILKRI